MRLRFIKFVVVDKEGVMLPLLQKTSATSHNYTTHSSVQHMIPSVQTTKFGLRSINFNQIKNNSFHTKSKSL